MKKRYQTRYLTASPISHIDGSQRDRAIVPLATQSRKSRIMPPTESKLRGEVTHLLRQMQRGDKDAREQLITAVYGELRKLAAAYFRRERQGHTLQPTALVNEAYLKLVGLERMEWQNRVHFFGVVARLMR